MSFDLHDKVRIKHSPRARRVALRLDIKERIVQLIIPNGMSEKRAQEFAHDHQDWIKEKLSELPPVVEFHHGKIIPLLGKDRKIEINISSNYKRTDIDLSANALLIKTNKDDPSKRIERYLKALAKSELSEMAQAKALDIGKEIQAISVRDTKSRWGSCSEDAKLSFSWRLIFAPTAAMDYVVAHECAHLIHINHSKAFWALCRDLSLDFVEGEYWMRNHGSNLMRYGIN